MKKVAAVLLLVGMTSATAFGGVATVVFDGPTVVNQGDPAVFNVSLFAATLGDIQGADIVLFADVPFSFEYAQAWDDAMGFDLPPIGPGGIFEHDIYAGGANGTPIGADMILFGTATIDTSALAVESSHTIQVDGTLDGFSQILLGTAGEPAVGSATFRVVPEPATLALLGIGAVALIRRRKTA